MEAVHAYLVRHATKGEGGMGKGEAESCISNCPSLRLSPRPFLFDSERL